MERKALRIATMILRAGGSELVAVCAHDFGDQSVSPQQAKFGRQDSQTVITMPLTTRSMSEIALAASTE